MVFDATSSTISARVGSDFDNKSSAMSYAIVIVSIFSIIFSFSLDKFSGRNDSARAVIFHTGILK